MQTLGLSSESKRSDGWLKSLLWPTVDNAWDVDYLGQQGLWICTLAALFTFASAVFSGNPLLILYGVIYALFFALGGMGIREGNWPAAAIVFVVFFLNCLARINIISLILSMVLLSNLRATFLASEWKPAQEGEDSPTRFNESLSDTWTDQLPRILWPKLQIPFLILGVIMLLLSLVELAFIVASRFGLMPLK
jgi:hypothetical protein